MDGNRCNIAVLLFLLASSVVVCTATDNDQAIVTVEATEDVPNVNHRLPHGMREGDGSQFPRTKRENGPATMVATTSVCDGLCNCTRENEIVLNVVCDFNQNTKYILDEHNSVPAIARTFHVNLGVNSQLYLRGKVFRQLNRISIDGGRAGGRQQIDVGPTAFQDNAAPFPEINLRHAQTLTIHGNAFQGSFKLNVTNVANVVVEANAFQDTSFFGHFTSVANLRFEKNAFRGTSASQITIVDSNLEQLERMNAGLKEIQLRNCSIEAIKANAFDVYSIQSIVLDSCDINVIESNFTTEKLQNDYLGIVGCRIGTIRSNAIASSGFNALKIAGNTIEIVESEAIIANAANFTFSNNVIFQTGKQWLTVHQWSSVALTNNSFGHFGSINVQGSGKSCLFNRNSITKWAEGSLTTMAPSCQFQDNLFSIECPCNFEWLERLRPGSKELRKSSYCEISQNLLHCFNVSTFNADTFYAKVCGESAQLDCQSTMAERKVKANFLDPNVFADNRNQYEKYLYLLGGVAILLTLIVILFIILRMRCHGKSRNTGNTATVAELQMSMSRQNTFGTTTLNKEMSFSHTEKATVDLALDKLRVKYPGELYEQVETHTRKLMTAQLSETEKVLTIGEIVRLLDECENIGDDFLAFTDILYRHLDENNGLSGTVSGSIAGGVDPLYSEPVIGSVPGTTVLPSHSESDNHVYAEPNSAQQPLLKTEYSLPLDRNDQVANVYADPVEIQRDKSPRLVSPYAIGNQLPKVVSPSNLPDVLSRSVRTAAAASPPTLPTPKLNTFGKRAAVGDPGTMLPMYSIPIKSAASSSRTPLQRDDSSASSCNSSSNHSGGSDITFKIDDIIDYADS